MYVWQFWLGDASSQRLRFAKYAQARINTNVPSMKSDTGASGSFQYLNVRLVQCRIMSSSYPTFSAVESRLVRRHDQAANLARKNLKIEIGQNNWSKLVNLAGLVAQLVRAEEWWSTAQGSNPCAAHLPLSVSF